MRYLIALLALALTGCAALQEQSAAIQAAEITHNTAEAKHANAETCEQIRAKTVATVYAEDIAGWHSWCNYD